MAFKNPQVRGDLGDKLEKPVKNGAADGTRTRDPRRDRPIF